MGNDLVQVVWFSIVTATVSTLIMLPLGITLAWVLVRRPFPGQTILETLVSLPLVLPPVATGLILLRIVGRRGPVGGLMENFGIEVLFTWKAVVLAMSVMGLPLLVRAARAGFEQVDRRYEQIAATLGASPFRVFLTISLPLAKRGILAGAVLAFARALGEFGATVMIAGVLPGTRTLSTAIYSYTQTGQDTAATALLIASASIAFIAVLVSNRLSAAR